MSSSFFKSQIDGFLAQQKVSRTPKPWLVLLEGDLGAGKTTWTQEFVAALGGGDDLVKSPTFLKLLSYEIPHFGQLLHVDAYRVEDPDEFLRIGLESYENVSAMIIEWPGIFVEFLKTYPEYQSLLGLSQYTKLTITIDPMSSNRIVTSETRKL